MGFFSNLFSDSNNNSKPSTDSEVIVLAYNDEEITINASDVNGRSLRTLYSDYAEDLGINTTPQRFISAGNVIPGNSVPAPGTVYRATAAAGEKG